MKLPSSEELIAFCLVKLREPFQGRYGSRECNFYGPNIAHAWVQENNTGGDAPPELEVLVIDAAWVLVRRGLLRPGGTRMPDMNASDPGRFSLTEYGRNWATTADEFHFVALNTSSISKALASCKKLDKAFHQRAQEAIRCRDADAWLATCVMCGAAAESVLLSLAFERAGSKEDVLKSYFTSMGRKRVTDTLLAGQQEYLHRQFRSLLGILQFWRDDAGHGMSSDLSSAEAEESLRQLLMLAQFSTRNWDELTRRNA